MHHTLSTLSIGLLGAGFCANFDAVPPTEPPAAPLAQPAASATARTTPAGAPYGPRFFGINEGLSAPARLVHNGRIPWEKQLNELRADATLTRDIGAGVVRANCHTYPFFNYMSARKDMDKTLQQADAYMAAIDAAGLETVMVVAPWPCIRTASHTDRYVPQDMDGYTDFVRTLVERYDADGTDDMPGMSRPLVVAWEVDNEPDLHNTLPPRGAPRGFDPSRFGTPAEYAEVLRATSAAIRGADPSATVLIGGIYNPRHDKGRAFLDAVLAEEGAQEAFDVMSLHVYNGDNNLDAIEQTIAIAQAVAPGKPLWITEFGVSSDERKSWATEDWQAQMVVALHAAAAVGGVERVFWHTLTDPPKTPNKRKMPFASHSLHSTLVPSWEDPSGAGQRTRKPAGEAYTQLTAKMATLREPLQPLPSRAGKAARSGSAVLVYWGSHTLQGGPWQVTNLRDGSTRTLDDGARVDAPAWAEPTENRP